jgi:hypothetical protein
MNQHMVDVFESQNEWWSERRLRLKIQPDENPFAFFIPRDRLIKMVLDALDGEFVED